MRSASTAKVLHGFAGRSMLGHVLAAADAARPTVEIVVVGHRRDEITAFLAHERPAAHAVVQEQQLGTGHATRVGLDGADAAGFVDGTVLVLPGDTPLLRPETLAAFVAEHERSGAAATLMSSVVDDPTGYGRIVRTAAGDVERVVEHRDAGPGELALHEVAAAVYAFQAGPLRDALALVTTDNAQGEQYLPDVIGILRGRGDLVGAIIVDQAETAGVNDRVQLAAAHRIANARLLDALMRSGVTVIDPATTWVDVTAIVEPDAVLLPGTFLEGATVVGAGARIGPETTLTDTIVGARAMITRSTCRSAVVGAEATVGPYAYLRPGADLGHAVHVGTFVEIKASDIGAGAKVPHLSYVGDASIGVGTNIGAGNIFANYDGVEKHRSTIGAHVRSGSDTIFVAPVVVGDGVYTAAGSTITGNVPPGAIAIGRAAQRNVAGWTLRRRAGTESADAAQRALDAEISNASDAQAPEQPTEEQQP
ncbi:MAG: bifunctional UDP-N-acetylglucosamine diphosphorylase/glucosamine-phosphate N-acetyltransferase [Pseudonocardiales bacterium]|nr:bifunctional UDP-N-acetylglucosamine diphosphorylase/glucosamine-phosphate N-acetyltransferase [Pseudonocardiales bacterium]